MRCPNSPNRHARSVASIVSQTLRVRGVLAIDAPGQKRAPPATATDAPAPTIPRPAWLAVIARDNRTAYPGRRTVWRRRWLCLSGGTTVSGPAATE
jgi:hypothetical protein